MKNFRDLGGNKTEDGRSVKYKKHKNSSYERVRRIRGEFWFY